MKKINIILSALLLLAILSSFANAQNRFQNIKGYEYIHLAITGEALDFLVNENNRRAFAGLRLPHYIGYLKVTQKFLPLGQNVAKDLKFVRMTDLPISQIEEYILILIKNRSIHHGTPEASVYFKLSDPGFLFVFSEALLSRGVDNFTYESYFDYFSLGNLPQTPKLKTEDFEFINSCVYRPYADPPEECKDLRLARLANEAAVEFKRDAYSDLYWEESVATLRRLLKK